MVLQKDRNTHNHCQEWSRQHRRPDHGSGHRCVTILDIHVDMRGYRDEFRGNAAVSTGILVHDPESIFLSEMCIERRHTSNTWNEWLAMQFEALSKAIQVTRGVWGHEEQLFRLQQVL